MTSPDLLAALAPVVDALERLGIAYELAGSIASSIHGVARSSLDVDLVADLEERDAKPLARRLQDEYYVEEAAVREATRRRSSFNVVHLGTMLKVDVFVLRHEPYEMEAFSRRRPRTLAGEEGAGTLVVESPEDTILHKLAWFRSGGEVSDLQWRDVIGVLQVQGEALDGAYLRRCAPHLGVADLLERAVREAGWSGPA